ncbi:polyketide cyclase [Mycobacterium sp. 852013-51886_SCH5428379]|uniref:nuclear transport factor 2 family protein n=1 Tax=Mycobacterium sp. 852013-51886_SCH5428379 TaxID=1834111 RepID=UPI0008019F6D|nr:nuclear transport factor 2 family protein [Mycobacterium sp. 852013-51886_SCH5428379]OBB61685.1 polyketide cyclase [Mycobacterium sp. 852013-51886_SCH5428379]
MTPPVIQRWHQFIEDGSGEDVADLLAPDAVFYSPALFKPQEGRDTTAKYLRAAAKVLGGEDFHYVNQWYGERSAVLEFVADLDGVHVNGIDMITWNDEGLITEFKVMLRPFKALQAIMPKMAELLAQ